MISRDLRLRQFGPSAPAQPTQTTQLRLVWLCAAPRAPCPRSRADRLDRPARSKSGPSDSATRANGASGRGPRAAAVRCGRRCSLLRDISRDISLSAPHDVCHSRTGGSPCRTGRVPHGSCAARSRAARVACRTRRLRGLCAAQVACCSGCVPHRRRRVPCSRAAWVACRTRRVLRGLCAARVACCVGCLPYGSRATRVACPAAPVVCRTGRACRMAMGRVGGRVPDLWRAFVATHSECRAIRRHR